MKRECSTFSVCLFWNNFERKKTARKASWECENSYETTNATCELMHKHLFPVLVWTSHPVSRSPVMRVCVPRRPRKMAKNRISNLENDRVSANEHSFEHAPTIRRCQCEMRPLRTAFSRRNTFEIAYGQGQRRERNPKRLHPSLAFMDEKRLFNGFGIINANLCATIVARFKATWWMRLSGEMQNENVQFIFGILSVAGFSTLRCVHC